MCSIVSRCPVIQHCQMASMCNTCRSTPKRGAMGLAHQVNETVASLVSDLVRKSDPGGVLRADGRADLMRWGFHRIAPGGLDAGGHFQGATLECCQ